MSVTGGILAGVATSAVGAIGASNAADAQSSAANHAADLQAQQSQKALDFQKQQYATSQAQQAPYLQAGGNGLNALQYGLGVGGNANGSGVGQGSLTTPYGQSFTAPTGLTEQNDPGYQARLQLGTDAIQRSAAARGSVLTGGTAKALDTYGQDYASNEYSNVYNRALNTYDTNFNAYNTNQSNQYNKLASLAGLGQSTATGLAQQGQAASNNVTSNMLGTGQVQGQAIQNAGNATASGYAGVANAINSGISGAANNYSNLQIIKNLTGSGYGSNPYQTLYNAQQGGIGGIQPSNTYSSAYLGGG